MFKSLFYAAVLLGFVATPAWAQDDDLDVTLVVIEDENTAEERLVNEIELPLEASDRAHENASSGLEAANQARQQGSEFGEERAESARDNGADQGPRTPENFRP